MFCCSSVSAWGARRLCADRSSGDCDCSPLQLFPPSPPLLLTCFRGPSTPAGWGGGAAAYPLHDTGREERLLNRGGVACTQETRQGKAKHLREHREHMVEREAARCFPAILLITPRQIQVAPVTVSGSDGSHVPWSYISSP